MKNLFIITIIISCFLFTSCLTTGKSAGIKENYDIKQLNAQMSVMLETINNHDIELSKLNERENEILSDMGLNLDKMEQEYNKKADMVAQIRQLIFVYDVMAPTVDENEQIVLKSMLYDKIKEIVNEENVD